MVMSQPVFRKLEQRLGHEFKNQALLLEALTHSTYAYEHRSEQLVSNERLEFLGDAVLDLAVGDRLFRDRAQYAEGFMTKTRALLVCENTLAKLARRLEVGGLLFVGKGEETTGGRDKSSNLANAMEALFGAVYLDAGFDKIRQVILNLLEQPVQEALSGSVIHDYKSRLLELIQGTHNGSTVQFNILQESGPVHERVFTAGVLLDDTLIASGSGNTKKEAEQQAARSALEHLRDDHPADSQTQAGPCISTGIDHTAEPQ